MKKILLGILLATSATYASADAVVYAGVNYGQVNYSEDGIDSDSAYGVHVGTGITPFVGVEAGYWDLGSGNGSADYSTWYVAAKPSMSFDDLEVYAKLGMNRYDISGNNGSSADGYEFMYGVGADYTIIDDIPLGSISAGVAYNSFGFSKFDSDTYSVSLTVHFL